MEGGAILEDYNPPDGAVDISAMQVSEGNIKSLHERAATDDSDADRTATKKSATALLAAAQKLLDETDKSSDIIVAPPIDGFPCGPEASFGRADSSNAGVENREDACPYNLGAQGLRR